MDWDMYKSLVVNHSVSSPDKEPLPTVEEIVYEILSVDGQEVKREEIVDRVAKVTGISKEDVNNNISTPMEALRRRGKIISGSKRGYWRAV